MNRINRDIHPRLMRFVPHRTYNLDPAAVEAEIGPRTRAIIAVSLFGQCADFVALHALAEPRGIWVIGDAARSLGSRYHGR